MEIKHKYPVEWYIGRKFNMSKELCDAFEWIEPPQKWLRVTGFLFQEGLMRMQLSALETGHDWGYSMVKGTIDMLDRAGEYKENGDA